MRRDCCRYQHRQNHFGGRKKFDLRRPSQTAMTTSCRRYQGINQLKRPIPTSFRGSLEGNTQLSCWTPRSTPSHKLTIRVIVFYMHRSALCVCAAVVIGDAVCFSIGSTLPQLRRSTSRYLSNAYLFGCVRCVHRLCLCAGLCSVRGLCMFANGGGY